MSLFSFLKAKVKLFSQLQMLDLNKKLMRN